MTMSRGIKSKLPLSLIPTSTHGQRLSGGTLIGKHMWDRLRRWVYQKANWRCEICGGVGEEHPVEAHEYWRFDDKKRVQHLDRIVALCPLCHKTVHLLGTGKQFGPAQQQKCIKHLAKLNGWDGYKTQKYIEQQVAICAKRCKHTYTVAIDDVHPMLHKASRAPLPWPKKEN